jgi:hypothetical protein
VAFDLANYWNCCCQAFIAFAFSAEPERPTPPSAAARREIYLSKAVLNSLHPYSINTKVGRPSSVAQTRGRSCSASFDIADSVHCFHINRRSCLVALSAVWYKSRHGTEIPSFFSSSTQLHGKYHRQCRYRWDWSK